METKFHTAGYLNLRLVGAPGVLSAAADGPPAETAAIADAVRATRPPGGAAGLPAAETPGSGRERRPRAAAVVVSWTSQIQMLPRQLVSVSLSIRSAFHAEAEIEPAVVRLRMFLRRPLLRQGTREEREARTGCRRPPRPRLGAVGRAQRG